LFKNYKFRRNFKKEAFDISKYDLDVGSKPLFSDYELSESYTEEEELND